MRSSIMVSMNRLDSKERAQIIRALVEGNWIRSTVRMTGFAKNTITKLLVELGSRLRRLSGRDPAQPPAPSGSSATRFGASSPSKAKTVPRSTRANRASVTCGRGPRIDADSKLVSILAGRRARRRVGATQFMRRSGRTAGQSRPDSPRTATAPTSIAVERCLRRRDVDYAMLVEGPTATTRPRMRRFSPRWCLSEASCGSSRVTRTRPRSRTSYVERSEPHDADGHAAVHPADQRLLQEGREPTPQPLALHFMYYNFNLGPVAGTGMI